MGFKNVMANEELGSEYAMRGKCIEYAAGYEVIERLEPVQNDLDPFDILRTTSSRNRSDGSHLG